MDFLEITTVNNIFKCRPNYFYMGMLGYKQISFQKTYKNPFIDNCYDKGEKSLLEKCLN